MNEIREGNNITGLPYQRDNIEKVRSLLVQLRVYLRCSDHIFMIEVPTRIPMLKSLKAFLIYKNHLFLEDNADIMEEARPDYFMNRNEKFYKEPDTEGVVKNEEEPFLAPEIKSNLINELFRAALLFITRCIQLKSDYRFIYDSTELITGDQIHYFKNYFRKQFDLFFYYSFLKPFLIESFAEKENLKTNIRNMLITNYGISLNLKNMVGGIKGISKTKHSHILNFEYSFLDGLVLSFCELIEEKNEIFVQQIINKLVSNIKNNERNMILNTDEKIYQLDLGKHFYSNRSDG